MKLVYPACFYQDKETGGYAVVVPDLPGCVTQNDDYERAFEDAGEALNLHLSCMIEDGEEIPKPSKIKTIVAKLGEGEALTLIETQI